MKKSLIALAVMAAAGAASAQSSVTLFGIVDVAVQRVSNSDGAKVTRMTNSGYNSSRLGFRGTEDLGGGMSASFWLEAGLNNDDGSGQATGTNNQGGTTGGGGLTFNRRSTVSLAGGWGELRLGRDYTPQFWNLNLFDPFGTVGVGATATLQPLAAAVPTAVRASNSIGYFLPANIGGFYGQLNYWMGENSDAVPATKKDGNGYGVRVGFANGPFNVALAVSKLKVDNPLGDDDVGMNNIAGSWDFGVAKAMAQYTDDDILGVDGRGYLLGALVPVGAGEIRASWSQYRFDLGALGEPKSRKLALGYVHNLSKRTAVYATYARVRNSNGAALPVITSSAGAPAINQSSSGFDLGLRHAF